MDYYLIALIVSVTTLAWVYGIHCAGGWKNYRRRMKIANEREKHTTAMMLRKNQGGTLFLGILLLAALGALVAIGLAFLCHTLGWGDFASFDEHTATEFVWVAALLLVLSLVAIVIVSPKMPQEPIVCKCARCKRRRGDA